MRSLLQRLIRAAVVVGGVVVWWIAVGRLWDALAVPSDPPDVGSLVVGVALLGVVVAGIVASRWRRSGSPLGRQRQ